MAPSFAPGEDPAWDSLDPYLRARLRQVTGPLDVLQSPKGSANLTYRDDPEILGSTFFIMKYHGGWGSGTRFHPLR